jgi:hypothetical protein
MVVGQGLEIIQVNWLFERSHALRIKVFCVKPNLSLTSVWWMCMLALAQLVHMLDDMSGELESMEQWLSRNGDALALMQKDMLEIEQVRHQHTNTHV